LSDLAEEIAQLKETILWARNVEEMDRSKEANEFWASIYGELTTDIPGRVAAAIGRAEGQVLRLWPSVKTQVPKKYASKEQ
jgi:hypothetical protein